jgi:hypothetical protein
MQHRRSVVRTLALLTLVPAGPVMADHSPLARSADADSRIIALLNGIEERLGDKSPSPDLMSDVMTKLITVDDLYDDSSANGKTLIVTFPQRLSADAEKASEPRLSINYSVFASVAEGYLKKREEPPQVPSLTSPPPADPKRLETQRVLMARGDAMLAQKNISAARLLFERAAEAGVGAAAFRLGNTYDPEYLTSHTLIGIKPDPVQAKLWYQKAAALGEPQAIERLKKYAPDMLSTQ